MAIEWEKKDTVYEWELEYGFHKHKDLQHGVVGETAIWSNKDSQEKFTCAELETIYREKDGTKTHIWKDVPKLPGGKGIPGDFNEWVFSWEDGRWHDKNNDLKPRDRNHELHFFKDYIIPELRPAVAEALELTGDPPETFSWARAQWLAAQEGGSVRSYKSTRRKSTKRKATRRKSTKRKSTKRKSMKRKNIRRKRRR